MFSTRNTTHEITLILLSLHIWLLVLMTLTCFGALSLWTGLVQPRVWACIGVMPGLSTIVENVGWKFLRLGSLLTWLLVAVVISSAPARTKFLAGYFPLTQIYFGKLRVWLFPSSLVSSIGSFDGGRDNQRYWVDSSSYDPPTNCISGPAQPQT
jgi:hypothetical protein